MSDILHGSLTRSNFCTRSRGSGETCLRLLPWVRAPLSKQILPISLPLLDIIDTLYRRPLAPPDPQLVLSGIINANSAYPASRRLEISLLDRTLEPDEVDRAGHNLYHACLPLLPQDTQPVTLREGQLALPAVAAFFALAHWAQAGISVEYVLRSGEVAASVNECSKP